MLNTNKYPIKKPKLLNISFKTFPTELHAHLVGSAVGGRCAMVEHAS